MASFVVNNGRNRMLRRTFGAAVNPIAYIGVGTSSTVPTRTSTALGAEVSGSGYARVAATLTYDDANQKCTAEATFTVSNINTAKIIREVALFDAISGGTMFGIAQVGEQTKDGTISMKVKITVQMTGD